MVLLPLVLVASRQCAATVTRPCILLLKVEASAYILMRFDSEYQHFRVRVEQRPQAMQKGKRRDTACLAFRRDFPARGLGPACRQFWFARVTRDRKSTRLNSSH